MVENIANLFQQLKKIFINSHITEVKLAIRVHLQLFLGRISLTEFGLLILDFMAVPNITHGGLPVVFILRKY